VIIGRAGVYLVVMRPATDMRCPALIGRAAERAAIEEVLASARSTPMVAPAWSAGETSRLAWQRRTAPT